VTVSSQRLRGGGPEARSGGGQPPGQTRTPAPQGPASAQPALPPLAGGVVGGAVDWRPTASLDILHRRADITARLRRFFTERGVLEVDTPVLQSGANLDHGVRPLRVDDETLAAPRFLPTSPEHPLKRLVAAGYGAVWALAPAFRAGERGCRHAVEFRMLEWYRPDWDDRRLAAEVIDLLRTLTGLPGEAATVTWREAYQQHAGIDPVTADDAVLTTRLGADASVALVDGHLRRDLALDIILVKHVEPYLGRDGWTILTDYPAAACAQARIRPGADSRPAAARFEIYRDGVELANGYHELTDASELAARLEAERAARPDADRLVHDAAFAAAMAAGLPDCAGVAVGFDRVLMLALGLDDIRAVQAFG
jgi:lysyl-tRNA synthetase class 2